MSPNYEELERAAVLVDEEGEQRQATAGPKRKPGRPRGARAGRLQPMLLPHVRVPIVWLTRDQLFDPEYRLYLFLLWKSFWGQRGVKLTNQLAAEIGLAPRRKAKALARLQQDGLVRVVRCGRQASTVWPKAIVG